MCCCHNSKFVEVVGIVADDGSLHETRSAMFGDAFGALLSPLARFNPLWLTLSPRVVADMGNYKALLELMHGAHSSIFM